jgi:hypothetical protein
MLVIAAAFEYGYTVLPNSCTVVLLAFSLFYYCLEKISPHTTYE